MNEYGIENLIGKVLTHVNVNRYGNNGDSIIFVCDDGAEYKMYHEQDCCETVEIEDIDGDLDDLVGSEILVAEERSSDDENASESATWTFYTIATALGWVTIRWYGYSNGYYSESAQVCKIKDADGRIGTNIKFNSLKFGG